jgi:CheY-like chemotaxis protein
MSLFGFNFTFLKNEAENFESDERLRKLEERVQTKRSFDAYLVNVKGKEISGNEHQKIIIVIDDSSTMILSVERDFKRIAQIASYLNGNSDEDKNFLKLREEIRRRYPSKEKEFIEFLKRYKEIDYSVTYFETERCGFEFLKSLSEYKGKIDYAIVDITFGSLLIDENEKMVSLDGIDVAVKIRERYPDAKILFNTGYDLSDPDNSQAHKIKILGEKIGNFRYTLKSINPYERLCDIVEMLSE